MRPKSNPHKTTDNLTNFMEYPPMFVAPMISFEVISQEVLNRCLVQWDHKMGALQRGNQGAICHALLHHGQPVAVTAISTLISPNVSGYNRAQACELSRVCAARADLNRVILRLWREFVFPTLSYKVAISYQDAVLHSGDLYRFDGWARIDASKSGPDTRSGRPGRDKWVWVWPPPANLPKTQSLDKALSTVLWRMIINMTGGRNDK